jgi:alkanesulfonate monooxygenase SsuD/methylene tetrahydromethanopterin reductase-like flavin-dependent oxidoreductase (luciferase family)
MIDGRRFRLGFFTYLEGDNAPEVYKDALELFVAADELGFDVGWVAQHHFGHHGGLPSPLVFFAALAERTKQIGVGTAIISLSLENPVRVAEDAAVFEAIFPGRLQLGIGTGFAGPATLSTFDRAGRDKRELYDSAIDRLIESFEGKPVSADGDVLHPVAPGLRQRLWEAPSTLDRVAESARRGSGLLLSRIAIGAGSRPTPEIQIPMVETYKRELPPGVAPRIGFSRTVYPTRQPETAYRNLSHGLQVSIAAQAAQGIPPLDLTEEQLFKHHNIHYGTPEQVIESLQGEPLIDEITDLICQVQPGSPSLEQTLEAIELIATQVAPALGWRPAREAVGVRV